MVFCWRTAPINYTQCNFFVFILKFYFLLCLVIKSEREDCVGGTKQQQGLQGGVTRVTLFCCSGRSVSHRSRPWDGSPPLEQPGAPALLLPQRVQPQCLNPFPEICCQHLQGAPRCKAHTATGRWLSLAKSCGHPRHPLLCPGQFPAAPVRVWSC